MKNKEREKLFYDEYDILCEKYKLKIESFDDLFTHDIQNKLDLLYYYPTLLKKWEEKEWIPNENKQS